MPDLAIDWRNRLSYDQSKLQDFVECSRRFQLRYLMQQDWPAPIAEPLSEVEQAARLGKHFHLLAERYWLGILPENSDSIDPALRPLWETFLHNPIPNLPTGNRRPEISTSAIVNNLRFTATFDLLAYNPNGEVVIVDWKTTKRRSTRAWLDQRLQTVIYPLLLVDSAERLIGYRVQPEQVKLIYWFAYVPTEPEIFQYSTARYEQDRQTLKQLTDQVLSIDELIWPLTPQERLCRFCQYRSLCERGQAAGNFDEVDDLTLVENSEPTILEDYIL